METVRHLAKRAGILLEEDENFKCWHTWAERQLVQRLHDALLNTRLALDYVTKGRGWTLETVRATRIGLDSIERLPRIRPDTAHPSIVWMIWGGGCR